jgi:hypothetical protein
VQGSADSSFTHRCTYAHEVEVHPEVAACGRTREAAAAASQLVQSENPEKSASF